MKKYLCVVTNNKYLDSFYKCKYEDYANSKEEALLEEAIGKHHSIQENRDILDDMEIYKSMSLRARFAMGKLKIYNTEEDLTRDEMQGIIKNKYTKRAL